MNPSPLLEARNLARRLPAGTGMLIESVSLEIHHSECVTLQGKSGAGKTVLSRVLAQLDPYDKGQLLLGGRDVSTFPMTEYRSRVMYLPQQPAMGDGKVIDFLELPFTFRQYRGLTFDRNTAIETLEQLDRDEAFLQRGLDDLSGGERQLTQLARAMLLSPSVLLLDEPTAALDGETKQHVEQLLMKWLNRASHEPAENCERGILWIGHQPEQLRRLGHRHYQMQVGRIRELNDDGTAT